MSSGSAESIGSGRSVNWEWQDTQFFGQPMHINFWTNAGGSRREVPRLVLGSMGEAESHREEWWWVTPQDVVRELSPHFSKPHSSPLDGSCFQAVKLFGVLLLKEEMWKQKAKKYGLCLLSFKGQVLSGKTYLNVWVPDEGKYEI